MCIRDRCQGSSLDPDLYWKGDLVTEEELKKEEEEKAKIEAEKRRKENEKRKKDQGK